MVINSRVIGNTKRTISSVEDITTKQLLDESMKTSPSYYVAAVVNANQYIPNHRMRYYLGAGDNTTDAEGRMFHNKELKKGLAYFFRIFSVDSTLEVCYIIIYYIYIVCLLLRMRFQVIHFLRVSELIQKWYSYVCHI